MSLQVLIALLLLLIVLGLSVTPRARSFTAHQYNRLRRHMPRRQRQRTASTGTTIITGTGEEVEVLEEAPAAPSLARRVALSRSRGLLTTVVALVIGLIIGVQLYRILTTPAPDQFVVLVAPFQESDGTISQTGREIAAALAAELQQASGGRVIARPFAAPPADEAAALAAIDREQADALIWGQVTPGSLLDSVSLQPVLAYKPNGTSAPISWEGYAGRFEMAAIYTLTTAPINGHAVLPGLLGALADYQAGRFDSTFNTLGTLLDNYPALAPALPRALRGNILWARGAYQEAAGEYRRALGSRLAAPQEARLYNNLGAILQDAGEPSAQDAFNRAVAALKGATSARCATTWAFSRCAQAIPPKR